jgi:RimJ/RimL family protein N-acetyltransferase
VYARVEANNLAVQRFDEHIGFQKLTTIPGAASDGGDVLVYVMKKEDCRHV